MQKDNTEFDHSWIYRIYFVGGEHQKGVGGKKNLQFLQGFNFNYDYIEAVIIF